MLGNSLEDPWLGLCTFTGEGPTSIPGWETGILQAERTKNNNNNNNKRHASFLPLPLILLSKAFLSSPSLFNT